LFRQYVNRLDPSARHALGMAAGTLSTSLDAAAWVRDRSATLRRRALTGDAALDAVNAASASLAEPPPVVSSDGMLLDRDDGVVGSRARLAGIDQHRRALTALNRQEFAADPARLRANQAAIDTDAVRRRAAVKADIDGLHAALRRHLTTGGPDGGPAVTPPPATIMSRLTDAQQEAVRAQVDAAIEGRTTDTDPQTWYAIRQGLTGDDAGERRRWASASLVPFMDRLSAEDYAAMETLQASVRRNDAGAGQRRLQAVARMADGALRSIGIDPTPRPDAASGNDAAQAAMFHRAVQDELSAFESRGRPPTEAEVYGIVTGLKDTGLESGFLRNRNAAADLAGAVARLNTAQEHLDELPASDPLRQLFEASSVAEAARLLHRHPGRIARAVGVEGVPALTVGLIATAVLGPIGGAMALTGTSGIDGYAKGLLGALSRAGVDVSNADDLTRALRDDELMERIRKDATTNGAIAAGVTAASMMVPIPKSSRRAPLSLAMKVPAANARGRGFPTFKKFKETIGKAPPGYGWHHIVAQTTENIRRFGAENIHNTNNLVLLPHGPGSIHNQISAIYLSERDYSQNMRIWKWIGKKSFTEQAAFGRRILQQAREGIK
jgi:hypothetical protein